MEEIQDEDVEVAARYICDLYPQLDLFELKVKLWVWLEEGGLQEIEEILEVSVDAAGVIVQYFLAALCKSPLRKTIPKNAPTTSNIRKKLARGYGRTPAEWINSLPENVQLAFEDLSEEYEEAIVERYHYGVTHSRNTTERNRVNTAIRKLSDRCIHEGLGSRQVWSNARAKYEIDVDRDGDTGGAKDRGHGVGRPY